MGFDAPGMQAPAELPAALISVSATTGRAMLVAGGQPAAAVQLLDIVAKGVSVLAIVLILAAVA